MPEEEETDSTYLKVPEKTGRRQSNEFSTVVTSLQWKPRTNKEIQGGSTLVVLKTMSVFNPVFFYQYLIMH